MKLLGLIVAVLFCGLLLGYGVTQEVPIGGFQGRVTMEENGKPIPGALVMVSLVGEPDEDLPKAKGIETDEDGNFRFRNLPAGDYVVEVSAKEHSMRRQRVRVEEGKVETRQLITKPNDPYLNLYASQKVFTPEETPRVELHGFVPGGSVNILLYRLRIDEIVAKGGLQDAIWPLARPEDLKAAALGKAGSLVANLSHTVEKRDAEGAFIEQLPLGKLSEGIYVVTCIAARQRATAVLNVSRLALVTKTAGSRTLCYTTDITTGKPVADVALLTTEGRQMRSLGVTGKDGTAEVQVAKQTDSRAAILARKGTSVAIVGFYQETLNPGSVWISGYTDRPAYRPGDTVSFKGWVRRIAPDGYRLPGTGVADVEVRDPAGNVLQKMALPVSVHGSFHGQFSTSKEGKPGGYNIVAKAFGGESAGMYANVVAYRKPEFSITVKPGRDRYSMGDRASAVVECRYYYGGPVVGAKVRANVYRSPVYRYQSEEGDEETVDSYGGGEYSEDIEATTDASGRAVIEFDTRAPNDPDVFTNDYEYHVAAWVTEDNSKEFVGEGKVLVTRGDFDLRLDVQNPVVAEGDEVEVLVRTVSSEDGKRPVAGKQVTIDAGREEWAKNSSVFISRERFEVTTGADGTARIKIPVTRRESIALRATAEDDRRRQVVASGYAYVVGSPAEAQENQASLKVSLDQKRYQPGQSAKALIQTSTPGGSALVTVQSEGILWRRVVPLETGSTLVDVPVSKAYAPNVYVTVAYVREKRFLEAQRRLRVERTDRTLKVTVRADRDVYKPGETANVTVSTTDAQGRPVPAEISLGVVDEGIYDIAEDETDLYAALYPARSDSVRTGYSFPEIYLDGGDKGSSDIPLRTNFRDTAAWLPVVQTGSSGSVTLPVELPDNLTEWRLTAIGLSDTSQAGMAKASFTVRKDLMARLQLPQYLVSGDEQRMTVVVANDTGRDQDVNVEVSSSGLQLSGELKQTVRVPNGRPQVVEFRATAGDAGTASVTARAWIDGNLSDGVQQSFPVLSRERRIVRATAGEGTSTVTLDPETATDPKSGDLVVRLSPSLAGDLVKSIDDLIDFPYGCVEQTMSRFMPSILVERAVTELGLPKPKRLAELPKIVSDSLARLDNMRHSDGGWGWWEYDATDPFMTALVLDGLDRARRAGYDVSRARPIDAVNWGYQRLRDPNAKLSLRDRAYLAYVLLRWGKREAVAEMKGWDLAKASPAALATVALAMREGGRPDEAQRAVDRLLQLADVGGEVVSWPSEEGAWGAEPTALALTALLEVRPDDPRIPNVVRYLMLSRQGDIWRSTRDTAYSIIGLTSYLSKTRELSGESTATVVVNGVERASVRLVPGVLEDPSWTVTVPRKDLGEAPYKVEIRKSGEGKAYFSATLTVFDSSADLKPMATDPGLSISRRYYRLEARRLESGLLRLLPSKEPLTAFASGDLVRVEITIESDRPRSFVLVEEPTPSSCRVTERTELGEYEEWGWWWSKTEILDDRLAFFARELPKGKSVITYNMRAEQVGAVTALPTTVRNMYDPGQWASTAGAKVEVTP